MIEYYLHRRQFHLNILQLLHFEQHSYSILIYHQRVVMNPEQMQLYNRTMHHRNYHLHQLDQQDQHHLLHQSYLHL